MNNNVMTNQFVFLLVQGCISGIIYVCICSTVRHAHDNTDDSLVCMYECIFIV